jgi:hypothetical protein
MVIRFLRYYSKIPQQDIQLKTTLGHVIAEYHRKMVNYAPK